MTLPELLDALEINLDLDGVFVRFYQAAALIIGRPYHEVSGAEAWALLDKVPHLFRDLEMLPDAQELWDGIQAFAAREGNVALRVLSALPLLTNELVTAPADKRIWVRKHLSATIPVMLVRGGLAKVLFVKPGAILIDDLDRNIRAWRAAGGVGILHRSARETLAELARYSRLAQPVA